MADWRYIRRHARIGLKRPKPTRAEIEEIKLVKMSYNEEDGLNMAMKHPMFVDLASAMGTLFAEYGAENYLETRMFSEDYGELAIRVQRVNGLTPHQKAELFRVPLQAIVDDFHAHGPNVLGPELLKEAETALSKGRSLGKDGLKDEEATD